MESLEQTLRSVLQPLTHNFPKPIEDAATQLIGKSCYRSLVHDINISDLECLKLAASSAAGIGIVGSSSIVKVPQILKLLNSQSAEGVSFIGYMLETTSFLVSMVYNIRNRFPFSTYGESALIAVQNVVVSVLVLQYSGKPAAAAVFVAGLAAAGYALYNESIVPMDTLQYLQAGAGVLGTASKVPQIINNYRQGGTGQLSAFAVFMFLMGSLTRIFTTLQQVDDKLILSGFIAGFVFNTILAAQMLYYWNSPSSKKTAEHKLEPATQERLKHQATGAAHAAAQTSGAEKSKTSPSTRRRG